MFKVVNAIVLLSIASSVMVVMGQIKFDWSNPKKLYSKSKGIKFVYDTEDDLIDNDDAYDRETLNDLFSDLLLQPRTKAPPTHIVVVQPPAIEKPPSVSKSDKFDRSERVEGRQDRDDDDRRDRNYKSDRSDNKYDRRDRYRYDDYKYDTTMAKSKYDRQDSDLDDDNRRYGSNGGCGGGGCCGGGSCGAYSSPATSPSQFDPTSLLALLLSVLLPLLVLLYYVSTNTSSSSRRSIELGLPSLFKQSLQSDGKYTRRNQFFKWFSTD